MGEKTQASLYSATGRRKVSTAQVRMTPGDGALRINKRGFETYFPREILRMYIMQPLEITELTKKYTIHATIKGGGLSGQAGALRHGIARAIIEIDERFRPILKKAGMLTRDPRMKERKKYGQEGARRKFQFSKR